MLCNGLLRVCCHRMKTQLAVALHRLPDRLATLSRVHETPFGPRLGKFDCLSRRLSSRSSLV